MKNPHKIIRYTFVLFLFLVLTLLSFHVGHSATQKTFILDLDNPVFRYDIPEIIQRSVSFDRNPFQEDFIFLVYPNI